jgi:hypothetical protein
MGLRGKLFDPTAAKDDVSDAQLPDRGALEVVTALPRLDEHHLSLRVQKGDRETRKAGAGAQIHHRRDFGELCIQRQRVQDQPPYHGFGVAVGGQVHPRRPAGQELRQMPQGLGERLDRRACQADLLEALPDESTEL